MENFTEYTDSGGCSYIDVTTNKVEYKCCRNENCYLFKDFGPDFFKTNFVHNLETHITPQMDKTDFFYTWALSNFESNITGIINSSTKEMIYIGFYSHPNEIYEERRLFLGAMQSNGDSVSQYVLINNTQLGYDFYFTVTKSGSTIECDIYTGPEKTPTEYVATLSITLDQDYWFRYAFAAQSRSDGQNKCETGWNQNFEFISVEPDCTNPPGYAGSQICGDPAFGQDPTHLYECKCPNGTCYWDDLGQNPSCMDCEDYYNQADCIANNCFWYNESCHTNPATCEDYENQTECESAGCYWWNNSCHSYPQGQDDNLVFIHHSCGRNWLIGHPTNPNYGCSPNCLNPALLAKGYIDERNDIYYGTVRLDACRWLCNISTDSGRPASLGDVPGDNTSMHHWILWFNDYITGVIAHGCATGINRIVMYKSCYPNSDIIEGSEPGDPFSDVKTIPNYKAIYRHPSGPGNTYTNDGYTYYPLEDVFAANPDILFINVTAPPLCKTGSCTSDANAARAREWNNWLKGDWLTSYNAAHPGLNNVAIFDWFDFLANPSGEFINRLKDAYYAESGNSHPNTLANNESTDIFATEAPNFIDVAWNNFIQEFPGICTWIIDNGGYNNLTIQSVFDIIDAYLLQIPPTGYTFIPTLQNVFGVIDYYLGFDGDAKTGCNFYG